MIFTIGCGPAQMIASTLRPGLSFSASKMRSTGAVKSVVAAGAYSSWMIFAFGLALARASLNALTPSRPKA